MTRAQTHTGRTETELARAATRGDRRALGQLVTRQDKLVRSLARHYGRLGVPYDDLVAEGRLALLHAARRFDPERGVAFATYARWWVRAYLQRYGDLNRRIVTPPRTRRMRRLTGRLGRVENQQTQQHGRPPTQQELAGALEVPPEELAEALAIQRQHDHALDAPVPDGHAYEPAAPEPSPEDQTAAAERRTLSQQYLERAMGVLDSRERSIVRARFLRKQPRSLASLGKSFGVSRERVRQLQGRALRKLRRELEPRAADLGLAA